MDSQADVTGRYIVSMATSAGEVSPVFERKIRDLLEEYGIDDPDPEQWYSADSFTSAVSEAAEEIGSSTILEAGKQMGQDVPQPESVSGPKDALKRVNEAHQAAYQNASERYPAGQYRYEELDSNEVKMSVTDNWPYPPEIAEGSLLGITQSTAPNASRVEVETTEPASDEVAAYIVRW